MKKKVLVTGGCGYIGAHTIVDLIQNGYEVISVDNLSKGSLRMLEGVRRITGIEVKNYRVDLCNSDETEAIFMENQDLVGIIHFAAFKSVPESVADPIKYFRNNMNALVNLLECAKTHQVHHFIFSSSCSVYGNIDQLPVNEATALGAAQSPYARTKQMGEQVCQDICKAYPELKCILLRYFNPVGAHPSAHMGELQEVPENLVPVITQTAIGARAKMQVYGHDYPTRDGSCIRDYIHVMDVAHAHTLALNYLILQANEPTCAVFNLGTGNGVSVLELIQAFEKVSGIKLNYELAERRAGDVVAVYADNTKVQQYLGWQPQYSIDDMMRTAWQWEKVMRAEKQEILN